MNTSHTPGPWRSTTPPSCLLTTRQIRTEHDELIADVGTPGEKGVGTIQNVANARLIAAAPELLHALQLVMTWNGIYDQSIASAPKAIAEFNMEVGDKIRSAIAKATGQTP